MNSSNIYINNNGIQFYFSDNEVSVQLVLDSETDMWFSFKDEKEMAKKLDVKSIDEIDSIVLIDLMCEEQENDI